MKKKIKRSPFTLSQTWKYCLAMWKWVSENYDEEVNNVGLLKAQWVRENKFSMKYTGTDCFFCDYSNRQKNDACHISCPGAMVAPRFDCDHSAYCYGEKPKKFYQKLLRLDAKRRKK